MAWIWCTANNCDSVKYCDLLITYIHMKRPMCTNSIGAMGRFCWVNMTSEDPRGAVLGLFMFYIPLWAVCIYNYLAYKAVLTYLSEGLYDTVEQDVTKRLSRYPKILVLCWFFPTINRLWSLFFDPNPLLDILHALFAPWQGFLNAVAYGMTDSVKLVLKRARWFPCLPEGNDESTENENLISQTQEMKTLNSPLMSRDASVEKRRRNSDIEIEEMIRKTVYV